MDNLRKAYIEELLRPEDHPLDPMAIAFWGGDLYISSQSDQAEDAVEVLRQRLRMTGEYRMRHGDLVVHEAKYGINDSWQDVTIIVQRAVRNQQLHLLVANETFKCDPAQYRHKQLKVIYTYKGETHPEKITLEDNYLDLP